MSNQLMQPALSANTPQSNAEFLRMLAGQLAPGEMLWSCSFTSDPSTANKHHWAGMPCTYADTGIPETQNANNYFSVSTVTPAEGVGYKRRRSQMKRMFVLVLDDIDFETVNRCLMPSYRLQTSADSFQAGYRLTEPISDQAVATRLLKALKETTGAMDPEGNNPVRYMRLPFGTNTKAKYGTPPFRHVLAEWNPERIYTVMKICTAFELDAEYVLSGFPPAKATRNDSQGAGGILPDHAAHLSGIGSDKTVLNLKGSSQPLIVYSPTPENIAIVEKMLSTFAPDKGAGSTGNRDKWVHTLWSVASLGWGDPGERLARTWSQQGELYDARAFDTAWQSYDRREDGITFGSLIMFARSAGYSGPLLAAQFDPSSAMKPSHGQGTEQDRGDVLNGRLFAELYLNKLKYVFTNHKWLRWDGRRWVWCDGGEHMEAAKETAREGSRRAGRAFSQDPRSPEVSQALAHARRSYDLKRLDAMLQMASSESGMGISQIAMLDADPMLLGVCNGVIDLRGGTLLQPCPEMLITRQCDADFDRDAKCPIWLDFLNTCFKGDTETIQYLQKVIGYTLTGDVSEEIMHFCYGTGNNGKSVMANVLYRIMNDYASVMRTESLMYRRHSDGPTNDIARLIGARLVLVNETKSDHCLDDARLKELVSTEAITARFLHQEYFEFQPTHKIMVRGNHKPKIVDTSDGAWRRVRLLPFEVQIADGQIDPDLVGKLMREASGILAWAVEGCLLWQKERLRPSSRVEAASAEYRAESDILRSWIDDECTLGPSLKKEQKIVWGNYREWCRQNGQMEGTKNSFTRRLAGLGVKSVKSGGIPRYSGIDCPLWPTTC